MKTACCGAKVIEVSPCCGRAMGAYYSDVQRCPRCLESVVPEEVCETCMEPVTATGARRGEAMPM